MARAGVAQLSTAVKQAEILKKDGNLYFSKQRFAAAIDAYTEEIVGKLFNLTTPVKAHYMLGLAVLQKQEYADGIKELEYGVHALDLGRGAHPNSYMVEDIWRELAKAKYLQWEHASSKRTWELQCLKYMPLLEACTMAIKEKHSRDVTQTEGFVDATSHFEQLKAVEEVFRRAGEADMQTKVPDYLCCKITLDIFRDPVITPSGITYERAVILHHLQKVGRFDPVTRESLDPTQLVPNFAVKEAVQAFLDKHGWAYKTPSEVKSRLDRVDFAVKEAVQAFLDKHGWAYKTE